LKVIGHETEKKLIRKYLDKNFNSYSFLFEGKKCTGKKLIALQTARAYLCDKNYGFGCGECKDCKLVNNLIKNIYEKEELNTHPEVKVVFPENGKEIKISQIREIIDFLKLKSEKGKVVIIDDSEKMNTEAANALLKTLEEPPEKSMIILIAENHQKLLPTIVSRLQKVRFKPLKKEEVLDILLLKGISEEKAKTLSVLSEGSLCLPLTILEDETIYKLATDFYNLLKLKEPHFEGMITFVDLIDKLELEKIYNLLDIIDIFINKSVLKGEFSVDFYEKYVEKTKEIRKSLNKGVKKKLAFEYLYLSLKGENHG
jgi:DNA polymerase-3 subunit delta'